MREPTNLHTPPAVMAGRGGAYADWLAEGDKPRCEADHRDGGVCSVVLTFTGTCPAAFNHA